MKSGKILKMHVTMKRITKAIITILIFAVGWIVGLIASDLSWFQYDNSFSIFDLFYAVISVGVAIYIAHVIENGLQNKRGQKDLIIKRIEEIDNAINDVLSSFNCESGKYQISNSKLLSQAKQIGMKYKRIESSIKKYYPEYAKTEAFKSTAINTRKLVSICTKTSKTSSEDISCENDIWTYSEGKFIDILKEISELRNRCFNNSLQINNL